jgi:Signal transduction histidine kinase
MMNKKMQIYSLINLIGVFFAVYQLMNIHNVDYIGIIVFAIILLLIGNIVYIYSYKDEAVKFFLLMIYMASWILLVPNTIISFSLISISPFILFQFFCSFFYFNEKKEYKIFGVHIICFCIGNAINILLVENHFITNIILALTFTYLIYCLFYLSVKYKKQQTNQVQLYQKELILVTIVSLFPFVIVINVVPSLAYTAFYFFLILPLFVGYIQIKRNSLLTKFSWKSLFIIVIAGIVGVAVYFIVGYFVLNINMYRIILMLILSTIIASIIFLIYQSISIKEWNEAYTTMQTFEQERVELLQIKIYENYLNAFNYFIEKMFELLPIVDGIIFSLIENDAISVLHRTGIFTKEEFNLNKIDYKNSNIVINNYYIEIHKLQTDEGQLIGYIITHTKNNSKLRKDNNYLEFNQLLKSIADLLFQSSSLRKYQKKYLTLPTVMHEKSLLNHYNEELIKTKHDVARYLHDEILQSLFAIKKYVEILNTQDIDLKEVVLKQLNFLNDILREEMNELYPLSLLDVSFYQNIIVLIEQLQNRNIESKGLNFVINSDELGELGLNRLQLLYRIIKELAQNVLKHADANNLYIDISSTDKKFIHLTVKDDGIGMILENIEDSNGFGLLSVKHSVNVLNGTMKMDSRKDNGTKIEIVFPIGESRGENESNSF